MASRNNCLIKIRAELQELYLYRKDYAQVLEKAKKVLDLVPGTVWAHEARGLAFLELGQKEEAMGELERAVLLDPAQSVVAMGKLIEIYLGRGEEEKAREMQARLKKILGKLPVSHPPRK